jgi:predicted ATPase/DNA-binding SARP family transcriptional activator
MAQNAEKTAVQKLNITLFGIPSVQMNGETVTGFISNKAAALLYFLAITGQRQTRESLTNLFWGEFPEGRAKSNLRDVLSHLHQLLGDHLEISRQMVGLNESAGCMVDVRRFEALLKEIEQGLQHNLLPPVTITILREAIDLYRGDLLDGFHVSQLPDFEMWLLVERARLQQQALQALQLLVENLTLQGDTAQSMQYARRLLALEPWREETHRQMMQLLVWSGQRSAALAQYEACRRILAESLGVEPERETRELYESILRGDVILAQTVTSARSTSPTTNTLSFKPTPHNLPAQLTRFVGREADLAELAARLHDPDCRLLVLAGPGGVGKTRLALQVAQRLLPEMEAGMIFRDGIYQVRLASIEQHDVERNLVAPGSYNPVAAAIADALQLTLTDPEAPASRIQNYLREKEMLLLMDNFEHLTAASSYLTALLTIAPGLKMLVTSRSRLNVRGEQVYLLDGLPFPGETADTPAWQGYSAVQLFLQTAQALDAGFTLIPEDKTAVIRICQLVDGLPLGLEMAASWVRVLACSEIVQELEQNLRFLRAAMHDVPERHRSLWAVFTYSWNMLTPEEQRALRLLSVFRGGFTREAAEVVTDTTLTILTSLIDRSFVRRLGNGADKPRFEILEMLRLYAAEHLQQNPAEGTAAYDRHCDYFMAALQQQEVRLQGEEQRLALAEIGREIENIRTAWRWSVVQQDVAALNRGLRSLFDYYDMRCRFQEGRDAFQRATTAVQTTDLAERETTLVYARLLARQGWFTFHVGRYTEARQLLQRSMELVRPLNAPEDLIFCLNYQGAIHFHLRQDRQAHLLCQEALNLSQENEYQPGAGISLNILSQIAYRAGDYEAAQRYGQQSLAIVTELGNPWSKAFSLSNLAQVAFARQEYDEVHRFSQTILEIREAMGDVRGMAMCLEQLARTAVAQQHPNHALTLYQRSLALYRDIGNPRGIISTLTGMGRIAWQQDGHDLSQAGLAELLQQAITMKDLPDVPALLSGLGLALREMGEEETAVTLENVQREA